MKSSINPLDKYIKLDRLGEGTYGVVYKAKHQETGEVSIHISYLIKENFNFET